MDILISGKSIAVTPSMKTYVEDRMVRLERFWKSLIRCHVEVSRSKHHKHGDVFVVYTWIESPGKDIRATSDATEFQEAVDLVYEKLERLIRKAKYKTTRV